jgi:hypothetical protein
MSYPFLLFILKIFLSAGMVITITLVAEKASTRFAGVLLGFPLGAGLTFFFTGVEQGPHFAAESAPWAIQGLSCTLVFCLLYNQTGKIISKNRLLSLIISTTCGICGFFGVAYVLQYLIQDMVWLRITTVATIFVGVAVFFRTSQSPAIKRKVPTTAMVLASRALFAAAVILIITAIAKAVGPRWSGIFAAFPTTVLPTVLVLHYHYGIETISALFREIPLGMLAIAIFSCSVYYTFPQFGVYLGILISYVVALFYLLFYEFVLRRPLDNLLSSKTR